LPLAARFVKIKIPTRGNFLPEFSIYAPSDWTAGDRNWEPRGRSLHGRSSLIACDELAC